MNEYTPPRQTYKTPYPTIGDTDCSQPLFLPARAVVTDNLSPSKWHRTGIQTNADKLVQIHRIDSPWRRSDASRATTRTTTMTQTTSTTPSTLSATKLQIGAASKPKSTAPKSILKASSFATSSSGRSVSDGAVVSGASSSSKMRADKLKQKEYEAFKANVIAGSKNPMATEHETAAPAKRSGAPLATLMTQATGVAYSTNGLDLFISSTLSSDKRTYTVDEIAAALGIMDVATTEAVPSESTTTVAATSLDDATTIIDDDQLDDDNDEDVMDFAFVSVPSRRRRGSQAPDSYKTFGMTKVESDDSDDSDWEEETDDVTTTTTSKNCAKGRKSPGNKESAAK